MKSDSDLIESAEQSVLRTAWFWPVLGLAVFLSFPYYFSLETFFSHEDFAILWFYKDFPPWKPWLFLQTEVLTNDYRPFQSYVFVALWRVFGSNPFPFCFTLLVLHLTNIVLFGRLVNRIFESFLLTLLSVIFFAANWEYCDVVFWKGNYGTAFSWLFTLGAANIFADYLRKQKWWYYIGSLGFFIAALLSKETAINVPLLLSLVYFTMNGQTNRSSEIDGKISKAGIAGEGTSSFWQKKIVHFVFLLFPFFLLTLAYVAFHVRFVHDAYDWLPKGYVIAPLSQWIDSVARAMNFWFTSPISANTDILPPALLKAYGKTILWFRSNSWAYYLLPGLLLTIMAFLRNRRLAFGIAWAVLAFFPANLITDYHTGRYYYGPLMGVAIILAELFVFADEVVIHRKRLATLAMARIAGSLLILVFVYANLFGTTSLVSQDAHKCRDIELLYREIAHHRGNVAPNTLFRVHCLEPLFHFHEGMGLREMFKLALDDDSVEAIFPGVRLSKDAVDLLMREYSSPIEIEIDRNGLYHFTPPLPSRSLTSPSISSKKPSGNLP